MLVLEGSWLGGCCLLGAGWLVAMMVGQSWGWVWWWGNGWLVWGYWGGEREVWAREVERMMAHGGEKGACSVGWRKGWLRGEMVV